MVVVETWDREVFFFSFFSSSFTSICNSVGYDRLQVFLTYMLWPGSMPFLYPFVLYLAAIIALSATFGLDPPGLIRATLHLLGRSSSPIRAPFLLLLLSPLHLFLRISVVVLLLFYFLASWLTISSRPGLAIQPLPSLVL